MPSQMELLISSLKAAFSNSIVFVLIILAKFDNLSFFESKTGEHSIKDALDIIAGKK
ncbi:MAG: hypothetical protein ACI9AR_000545 [Flavobacteriaceae bacterium]